MEKKYKLTSTKGTTLYLDSPIFAYTYTNNSNGDTTYHEGDIRNLTQADIDVLLDQFKKIDDVCRD